ncbi:UDP-3-O-(3-hydroxymyristoyl)glucosamine N-acyltransferase [Spirulina subsalsa]|uniref:UDP-3-O-(3-hydroxymyristoyl)glucosamine N-acyltransferase n=1 Tax=Spirulina subsalsa TaxID=54311 RepID=UPI0003754005|nr:UDP-3-O-(3-hydroxymyristoyl)glucosamine N-acyltransferase [Spirulina subsalsa]
MRFDEIVNKLKSERLQGSSLDSYPDCNPQILSLASVDEATEHSLSYVEGGKFRRWVKDTAASALILPLDEELQKQASERGIAWMATASPRLLFAEAIALFYQPYRPKPQIHPTAVIDPTVRLGQDVSIGAYVVIMEGCTVGDRVCIFPNSVIYPGVSIGADTTIHANCTVEERTQIGSRCVLHSGCCVGGEGFGFVVSPQGWFKMEQGGIVVLEDQVEVGCNTTIDRPPMGETRIGFNTKLDNLVQIGHGCKIGSNCSLSAQAGLSGQVKVGNQVILAGQVGVANQVTIGEGAIATAQSGLHKDVPPQQIVSGTPAIPNKLWLKISAVYNRLPEMYKKLRQV